MHRHSETIKCNCSILNKKIEVEPLLAAKHRFFLIFLIIFYKYLMHVYWFKSNFKKIGLLYMGLLITRKYKKNAACLE